MKESTKNRIIEAGAHIIHSKGFHHTGIQEVLAAAKVPKGSFYFYFKSKEDFGLAVIDYFNAHYRQVSEPIFSQTDLSPLERIAQFLEAFKSFFKSKNYTLGCPIGNLSQEMGDLNSAFRAKLKKAFAMMVDSYTDLLDQAQAAGEIPADLDVHETASFIVSSWHGALAQMKIEKSLTPLNNHSRFVFERILRN